MASNINIKHLRLIALAIKGDTKKTILAAVVKRLGELSNVPNVKVRGFEARQEGEPTEITWSAGNLLTWIRKVDDMAGRVLLMRLAATLERGPEKPHEAKDRESQIRDGVVLVPGFSVPQRELVTKGSPAGEVNAVAPTEVTPEPEEAPPEPAPQDPAPETILPPAGPEPA